MQPALRLLGGAGGLILAIWPVVVARADNSSSSTTGPPITVSAAIQPGRSSTTVIIRVVGTPSGEPDLVQVTSDADAGRPAELTIVASAQQPARIAIDAERPVSWSVNRQAMAWGCGPHPARGDLRCARSATTEPSFDGLAPPASVATAATGSPTDAELPTAGAAAEDQRAAMVEASTDAGDQPVGPAISGTPTRLPNAGDAVPDASVSRLAVLVGLSLMAIGGFLRRSNRVPEHGPVARDQMSARETRGTTPSAEPQWVDLPVVPRSRPACRPAVRDPAGGRHLCPSVLGRNRRQCRAVPDLGRAPGHCAGRPRPERPGGPRPRAPASSACAGAQAATQPCNDCRTFPQPGRCGQVPQSTIQRVRI